MGLTLPFSVRLSRPEDETVKPSEDPPKIDYSVIRGMDPSASWLLGPGSHCFLPDGEQTLVPFILKPAERIATLDALLKTDPDFYIAPSQQEILDAGGHGTALARRGFFDRVATQEDEVYLSFRSEAKDILLCSAQDTAALPALGTRYETSHELAECIHVLNPETEENLLGSEELM